MTLQRPTGSGSGNLRERGQALVLAVLAMTGLMSMAGLTADGGMAYIHRRQMQNAADAGALDGTAVLVAHYNSVCSWETAARTAATTAAQANGVVNASDVTVSLVSFNGTTQASCNSTTTMGVKVSVKQSYETYFSKLLGINSIAAGAAGTAAYGFVSAYTSNQSTNGYGALPIVLNNDAVPANPGDGTQVILQPANYGGGTGSVNYGNIDPTQYGQTLADAVANGLKLTVVAGQGCASTPTGTPTACKAGGLNATDPSILANLQSRINSAPTETWSTYARDSRRVVVVMVGDGNIGGSTINPVGFAVVFIDSVTANNLYVHFVRATLSQAGSTIDLTRTTNTSTTTYGNLVPPVMRLID